jgi:hypothetical protein
MPSIALATLKMFAQPCGFLQFSEFLELVNQKGYLDSSSLQIYTCLLFHFIDRTLAFSRSPYMTDKFLLLSDTPSDPYYLPVKWMYLQLKFV